MRERRGKLDAEDRAKANLAIQKQILAQILPEWKMILMFVGMRDEVATAPLFPELLKNGKRMCVPVFDRSLKLYYPSELKNFELDLEPGWFGILEPKPAERRPVAPAELDAVFLPGLAFDRQGNRLGYGRGYFDRLCRGTRAYKIALAYQFQIVDRVEATPSDVPVHMIITEKEVVECPKS